MRLALALLALLAFATPGFAADTPEVPPFDVTAALTHLETTSVYSTPGAIAHVDLAEVKAAIGTDVKVLITPFRAAGSKADGDLPTYEAIDQWGQDHKVQTIYVSGVSATLTSGGQAEPSDLVSARNQLGKEDVTDLVVFLAKVAHDPSYRDDNSDPTPDDSVPMTAAQVAPIAAALTTKQVYVAPGAASPGSPSDWTTLPGRTVRVAVLPVAPAGKPWPAALPALHARFPDDEVIVIRGHYLEATGPSPQFDTSAADYLLGTYGDIISAQQVSNVSLVNLFLKRLAILRSGVAFSRTPVHPPSLHRLVSTYAPYVGLLVAILLAVGSSLTLIRRGRRTTPSTWERDRATVYAGLTRLNARLVEAGHGPAVGRAAERHSEALELWDKAQHSHDPEVLDAAGEAVRDADRLLDKASS